MTAAEPPPRSAPSARPEPAEGPPEPPWVVRVNAAGLWVEDAEGRLRLNLPGASAAERERVRQIVEQGETNAENNGQK